MKSKRKKIIIFTLSIIILAIAVFYIKKQFQISTDIGRAISCDKKAKELTLKEESAKDLQYDNVKYRERVNFYYSECEKLETDTN